MVRRCSVGVQCVRLLVSLLLATALVRSEGRVLPSNERPICTTAPSISEVDMMRNGNSPTFSKTRFLTVAELSSTEIFSRDYNVGSNHRSPPVPTGPSPQHR